MDKIELIKTLPPTACESGLGVFLGTKSNDEIVSLFWDYIDFCLAMNFPSCEFISQNIEIANRHNMYVNHKNALENIRKGAFLGESICSVVFMDFAVSRVYVKHNSKINIKATGNAFVMVDALDDSDVIVDIADNARVLVNLYSKATCTGATKIIQKHLETYELQA